MGGKMEIVIEMKVVIDIKISKKTLTRAVSTLFIAVLKLFFININ